jgi:hypothetical protein
MSRTSEFVYVGNPDDLIRAHDRIRGSNTSLTVSTETSGKKMEAANARFSASAAAAGDAAARAAAKIKLSADEQASAAGKAAARQAAAVGASVKEQEGAYARAADAARASSIRSGEAAKVTGSSWKGAGLAIAAGAAIVAEGVKHSAGTLAELAKETRTLHSVTGLNTQAASAYAAVAKAQDIPVKALNQSLGTLSKNLHAVESAHNGSGKAAHAQETALKQLGVPLAAVMKAHGDLGKILPEIEKRFAAMPGGVTKTAVAMALFGRGWQTLVPLMKSGELGMSAQLKVAKEMGATLSGSTAHQTAEYAKEQERAEYATMGLQVAVGEDLAPALTKFIRASADAVHASGEGIEWLKKHEGAAKAAAFVIGTTLGGALTVYSFTKAKKFVTATADMGNALAGFAKSMIGTAATVAVTDDAMAGATVTAAGTMKAALMTTGVGVAIAALGVAAYELSEHWEEAMEALESGAVKAANVIIEALNKAKEAVEDTASLGIIPALKSLGVVPGGGVVPNIPKVSAGGGMSGKEERENEAEGSGGRFSAQGTGGTSGAQGSIMEFFMKRGYSSAGAAGIVGNLQQESSLIPGTNTSEGIGLASWHDPGRIAALKQFAKSVNKSWTDELVQLEFILKEGGSGLASLKHSKSATKAAEAFNKLFEGGTDPSRKREKYANEAYYKHPQSSHHIESATEGTGYATGGNEKKTEGLNPDNNKIEWHTAAEWRKINNRHAQRAAAGKGAASAEQIDEWAEEHVGKFKESWGKNTGPELDQLEKKFGLRVQEWCAMFATTAAAMGGASKAVKTASVATIREWAEAGTHGYKKGVSKTAHVGDMMMFGNEHVGFVQSVHGDKVTTIEGNTSGGKVEVEHRTMSEGTFASPIYRNKGGAGSVIRDAEAGKINQDLEKELKLELTAAKKAQLHALVAGAGHVHGERESHEGTISANRAFLQAHQARWALDKPDLTTTGGQKTARDRDETAVLVAQSEKKEQQRALTEIRAEAANWKNLREGYRHTMKKSHGNAKKEAKEKAAQYDAKFKQAQIDAKAMEGSIVDTETGILEAEAVLNVTLPEEIAQAAATAAAKVAEGQSNDLSAYQGANSKIDAELRAGLITEDQAKAAKIANAQKALAGGYGALSEEGILQVKGDLKEFSEALTEATSAVEAHTKALEESAKALREFNQESQGLAQIQVGVLLKAIADSTNGQIAGVNYQGRKMTAGAGSAAAY